jgi:hypothetical protein
MRHVARSAATVAFVVRQPEDTRHTDRNIETYWGGSLHPRAVLSWLISGRSVDGVGGPRLLVSCWSLRVLDETERGACFS